MKSVIMTAGAAALALVFAVPAMAANPTYPNAANTPHYGDHAKASAGGIPIGSASKTNTTSTGGTGIGSPASISGGHGRISRATNGASK